MFGSITIGSVFGIRARLHWTFIALIVVLLVVGYPFGHLGLNAAALGVFFGIVFLHELGHGIVARRFGLQVLDVTLWPLGGMTRMTRIPEDARIEGWIAFAGPAVNLALGLMALPFAPEGTLGWAFGGKFESGSVLESSAALFALANFTLAGFNLLPAFPLDGGRIARALLATRTDWVSATQRATSIGKWVALAMIAYGLYSMVGDGSRAFFWPIFGVFLWFSGLRESWNVRMRHVGQEFARAMGVPVEPPIVEAQASAPAPRSSESPGDPSGARRPTILRAPSAEPKQRLSDEQIAELERFRGRIGRG